MDDFGKERNVYCAVLCGGSEYEDKRNGVRLCMDDWVVLRIVIEDCESC